MRFHVGRVVHVHRWLPVSRLVTLSNRPQPAEDVFPGAAEEHETQCVDAFADKALLPRGGAEQVDRRREMAFGLVEVQGGQVRRVSHRC
jgi:hypothetical protein